MIDEDFFFDKADGTNYLESLAKTRLYLISNLSSVKSAKALAELEDVILLEIELAKIGAEKAMSEIRKAAIKENNVTSIK
jgi:hypothetical protein